jgi:HlyD family secretion protein
VLLALACKEEAPVLVYQAVPVVRRTIVVSVRAAGQVLPDTVVEVKSKASGEILDIHVETGQVVPRGALMVRIDQRTARNTLAEAEAALEVAKARLANAEAQRRRSDQLFKSQSITEQEHETAVLAVANANAEVVRAEVSGENARISMDDTDVRAPIAGTVITKSVERGQVISSPTRDVGGGTVLLKMADLNLVQVRTLVDETDIGKIRAGLRATVTVDAYPNQPFEGSVLKIEPQAETQQNVTMFAVLVRIENRSGLLRPGMNSEVEVHVGQRDSVLAVPSAALRTPRDVESAADVLGIPRDQFQTLLAAADSRRDSLRAAERARAPRPDSAGGAPEPVAEADAKPAGNTMTMPDGRTITLPEGVTESQVREIFRKRMSGAELNEKERGVMQRMMASFSRNRGGPGGPGGPGGVGAIRPRPQGTDYQFGGNYIVIVKRGDQFIPEHVRTGLTDLDYSEVVSGLQATDSVIVLPSASLVRSQEEFRTRIGQMTGQGVPGMRQQTQPGAQGGATGAGAGARNPGGGR